MQCSRVKNLLSAYSDRELGGDEMLAIRRHLGDCPDCRQEQEGYQQVKQLFRALTDIVPESGFDPTVLDRPRAYSRQPSMLSFWLETLRGEAFDRLDTLRRWSRRMFPTFHTEAQLVVVTCVSMAVVAAMALQRPQPADAVRAHVPEILASDYDERVPNSRLVSYSAPGSSMRALGIIGPDGRIYLFRSAPSESSTGFQNERYWSSPSNGASLASHRR
jgi:anti-sigma factor RsiW